MKKSSECSVQSAVRITFRMFSAVGCRKSGSPSECSVQSAAESQDRLQNVQCSRLSGLECSVQSATESQVRLQNMSSAVGCRKSGSPSGCCVPPAEFKK